MQRVVVVHGVINVGATGLDAIAIIPIVGEVPPMNAINIVIAHEKQMNYVQQEAVQTFPLITL